MKRGLIAVLALVMVFAASLGWAKTYKMGTYQIPLMVESKDKRVFIDLVKEVIGRTGEQFEIVVAPPKRTVASFHKGAIDGFFPCLDVLLQKDAAKSKPIYVKADFAFTRSDAPIIKSISQLEGKKVGITVGYPYAKALISDKKIKLEGADNDVLNMKKLSKGRIDAFVVEEKTGVKALKDRGWPEGVGYWGYGMCYATLFADALERVTVGKENLFKHPFMKTGMMFQISLKSWKLMATSVVLVLSATPSGREVRAW